jgi:GT2 family glycosyltransferase
MVADADRIDDVDPQTDTPSASSGGVGEADRAPAPSRDADADALLGAAGVSAARPLPVPGDTSAEGSSAVLKPPAHALRTAFRGNVDQITDTEVGGWIAVPDQPQHRCTVGLKKEGRILARAVASRFRADLLSAGIGDGCYAFSLQVPRSLLDGEVHPLEVVEEASGVALTEQPILWRSGADNAGAAPSGLGGILRRPRTDGVTRRPEPAAGGKPVAPIAVAEDAASPILQEAGAKPGPRASAGSPPPPSGGSDVAEALPGALPAGPRNRLLADPSRHDTTRSPPRQAVEVVVLARGGGVMVVGWINDIACPIETVTVSCAGWRVSFDTTTLARVRRTDVETALETGPTHLFGFVGLVATPNLDDTEQRALVDIRVANGGQVTSEVATRVMTSADLRDLLLGYLAGSQFFGNPQSEGVACLEPGLGAQVLALNQSITKRITAARHVERFGVPHRQPLGSIIVCLYGRAEFLFVQNALFAGLPGIEDYEFVFVSNSPEMAEELLREAQLAQRIYGLNQAVVLLPGNAGFGAANNLGVAAARGRRILNVNPDVLPRQADWARRHTELIDARPAEQTRLFGVPLYYDDGSLMHGGMYFELDSVPSIKAGSIEPRRMLRVEHYGKGAPDWAATYAQARPVPAVTGAFISSDRAWYERLGGFSEDYVLGHYEDADLCLRSFEQGTPSWLHDLRLWHLEGKGSTRRAHHEGASLVNRWHFTNRWLPTVSAGLLGPAPTHPALARGPSPARGKIAPPRRGPRPGAQSGVASQREAG